MNKVIVTSLLLLVGGFAFSQTPEKFKVQKIEKAEGEKLKSSRKAATESMEQNNSLNKSGNEKGERVYRKEGEQYETVKAKPAQEPKKD